MRRAERNDQVSAQTQRTAESPKKESDRDRRRPKHADDQDRRNSESWWPQTRPDLSRVDRLGDSGVPKMQDQSIAKIDFFAPSRKQRVITKRECDVPFGASNLLSH